MGQRREERALRGGWPSEHQVFVIPKIKQDAQSSAYRRGAPAREEWSSCSPSDALRERERVAVNSDLN